MINDIPHCEFIHAHPDTIEKIKSMMPNEDMLIDLAELFKVFGDSTRIKILSALSVGDVRLRYFHSRGNDKLCCFAPA